MPAGRGRVGGARAAKLYWVIQIVTFKLFTSLQHCAEATRRSCTNRFPQRAKPTLRSRPRVYFSTTRFVSRTTRSTRLKSPLHSNGRTLWLADLIVRYLPGWIAYWTNNLPTRKQLPQIDTVQKTLLDITFIIKGPGPTSMSEKPTEESFPHFKLVLNIERLTCTSR